VKTTELNGRDFVLRKPGARRSGDATERKSQLMVLPVRPSSAIGNWVGDANRMNSQLRSAKLRFRSQNPLLRPGWYSSTLTNVPHPSKPFLVPVHTSFWFSVGK
jgi:hypothetical protein